MKILKILLSIFFVIALIADVVSFILAIKSNNISAALGWGTSACLLFGLYAIVITK
jgi:hypothetical protein